VKGYRLLQAVLYIALATLAIVCFTISFGCSTTDPTFQAPRLQPIPFPIPVPPAERTCNPSPDLSIGTITLEDVEADGSVHIQALTVDVLTLIDLVVQSYNECVASNEARQLIIKAAKEAQAELERIIAEANQ